VAADYYALLGVTKTASDDEIKRAYRTMARELHPDTTGGDAAAEAQFKEVTRAYETLRDPERRARYDRFGPEGLDGRATGTGDFFGGGLGDIFDAFFGGGVRGASGAGGPVRGADAEVVLELSFREAVFGSRHDVLLDGLVSCATCEGSGARAGTTAVRCPDCQGTGELRRVRQSILGQVVTAAPCRRCQGLGEAISSPCPDCARVDPAPDRTRSRRTPRRPPRRPLRPPGRAPRRAFPARRHRRPRRPPRLHDAGSARVHRRLRDPRR